LRRTKAPTAGDRADFPQFPVHLFKSPASDTSGLPNRCTWRFYVQSNASALLAGDRERQRTSRVSLQLIVIWPIFAA